MTLNPAFNLADRLRLLELFPLSTPRRETDHPSFPLQTADVEQPQPLQPSSARRASGERVGFLPPVGFGSTTPRGEPYRGRRTERVRSDNAVSLKLQALQLQEAMSQKRPNEISLEEHQQAVQAAISRKAAELRAAFEAYSRGLSGASATSGALLTQRSSLAKQIADYEGKVTSAAEQAAECAQGQAEIALLGERARQLRLEVSELEQEIAARMEEIAAEAEVATGASSEERLKAFEVLVQTKQEERETLEKEVHLLRAQVAATKEFGSQRVDAEEQARQSLHLQVSGFGKHRDEEAAVLYQYIKELQEQADEKSTEKLELSQKLAEMNAQYTEAMKDLLDAQVLEEETRKRIGADAAGSAKERRRLGGLLQRDAQDLEQQLASLAAPLPACCTVDALGIDLLCKTCFQQFEEPYLLHPCGHTICRRCILWLSPERPVCPECSALAADQRARQAEEMAARGRVFTTVEDEAGASISTRARSASSYFNPYHDGKDPGEVEFFAMPNARIAAVIEAFRTLQRTVVRLQHSFARAVQATTLLPADDEEGVGFAVSKPRDNASIGMTIAGQSTSQRRRYRPHPPPSPIATPADTPRRQRRRSKKAERQTPQTDDVRSVLSSGPLRQIVGAGPEGISASSPKSHQAGTETVPSGAAARAAPVLPPPLGPAAEQGLDSSGGNSGLPPPTSAAAARVPSGRGLNPSRASGNGVAPVDDDVREEWERLRGKVSTERAQLRRFLTAARRSQRASRVQFEDGGRNGRRGEEDEAPAARPPSVLELPTKEEQARALLADGSFALSAELVREGVDGLHGPEVLVSPRSEQKASASFSELWDS